MPKRGRGFTLIELIISVAIIAILTAIAVPAYSAYVQRAARAEAKSALLLVTQAIERFHTENGTYVGATVASNMAQTPSQGAAKYQIAISGTPTTSTFALSATPVGSMVTDECGTFTIDQSGFKTAATASTGALYTKCWK